MPNTELFKPESYIAAPGVDPAEAHFQEALPAQRRNGDSHIYTTPPQYESLLDPKSQIVRDYRMASSYSYNPRAIKDLRVDAGTLLSYIRSMGSNDPSSESFMEIARGLAFRRTPHDYKKGPAIDVYTVPELKQKVIAEYASNLAYMRLMTMPSVLEGRLEMLRRGSPGRYPRRNQYFDNHIANKTAITWKNIGWGIPERDLEHKVDDESTTFARSQGMWSHIYSASDSQMVASPVCGPSHPDLLSPLAMADLALCGSFSFVPCDAIYSSGKGPNGAGLKAQIEFVKATQNILKNHPLILNHPYGNHVLSDGKTVSRHLYDEAIKRIGVTLKPHPTQDSVERAKRLYNECGVTLFRVFDPRDTQMLPRTIEAVSELEARTVEEVREVQPDQIIPIASQVTGVNSAMRCRDAGARVIVLNIGEGGFCSTSSGTGMIPSNLLTFYRIQRELHEDTGIIVDGGVGNTWVLALALGATATMKHASLIGGTVQQVPIFTAIDEGGSYYKLASGEAAKRTKFLSNSQTDLVGDPRNVEGVDGAQEFLVDGMSMSIGKRLDQNFYTPAAKQLVFCGTSNLAAYMDWLDPVIWEPTSEAMIMAAPHI